MDFKWPVRSFQKCKPYVLVNYTDQNIYIFNILPVKKETYYCNIKVISKEKQDGTILA